LITESLQDGDPETVISAFWVAFTVQSSIENALEDTNFPPVPINMEPAELQLRLLLALVLVKLAPIVSWLLILNVSSTVTPCLTCKGHFCSTNLLVVQAGRIIIEVQFSKTQFWLFLIAPPSLKSISA